MQSEAKRSRGPSPCNLPICREIFRNCRESRSSLAEFSNDFSTLPVRGEPEFKPGAAAGETSIAMQPKASLLLGPGPGQRASKRRDGEARRRRPVEEARDDSW